MPERAISKAVDDYTDDLLVEIFEDILTPLGRVGINRISELLPLLFEGLTGAEVPIEDLRWENLDENDREFMSSFINAISPAMHIWEQLPPQRRNEIASKSRQAIFFHGR